MKKLLALLMVGMPLIALAADFQSTLVVQTGELRESDLIVRNITDLGSHKTCLAFYIRTTGTSPVMTCYDAKSGFGAALTQMGHLKVGELIIRKLEDLKNGVACLVAYVSTPGTSPSIDCYPGTQQPAKDSISETEHLHEGDLDVRRISDPAGMRTCLVAYVNTKGTSPSVLCYPSQPGAQGGSLRQVSYLREGDLVVRKVFDSADKKACMVTYVSTEGTSSHLFCYDEQ